MNRKRIIILVIALSVVCGLAVAQRPSRKPRGPRVSDIPKNDQDLSGRFTFVRIRYLDTSLCPPFGPWLGDEGFWWSHDYPVAGRHLMKIMSELSKIDATIDVDEPIVTFEDPMLFKYPFAYLCEVGFMNLSEKERAGLREYILRGGFLLIDDFRGPYEFQNMQSQLKQALPEYDLKRLDQSHPIFNCFFSIKTLDVNQVYRGYNPEFWGMEDKDGRLMMIINYNYDVSDYWQFSDNPFRPIEETNEAYKFGVNYIMYALTH